MTDIDEIVKCSECNSRDISFDEFRGERYCNDCGLVVEEEIAESTSSGREKASDPSSPMTHTANKEGYILGSVVGIRNADGSLDRSPVGRTLRKWQKRAAMTSREKNQVKGIVLVNMLMAEFGIKDSLLAQAVWNYKRLQQKDIMRGSSLEVRAAAICYYTFKDNGISRTIDEVCRKNSAHPRQVARLARKIAAFFRKPWVLSQRNINQEVEKYCSMLGIRDRRYTSSAIELSDAMHRIAQEKYVTTNVGFLAACLYLTGRLLKNTSIRTQAEISEVCNITEVTLRNNFLVILKLVNTTRGDLDGLSFDDFMTGAREVCRKEE